MGGPSSPDPGNKHSKKHPKKRSKKVFQKVFRKALRWNAFWNTLLVRGSPWNTSGAQFGILFNSASKSECFSPRFSGMLLECFSEHETIRSTPPVLEPLGSRNLIINPINPKPSQGPKAYIVATFAPPTPYALARVQSEASIGMAHLQCETP